MYDLPLFPLNTVLFPSTPIHLHIFEERYLQMIQICTEQHMPFGVVLIRRGSEAFGPLAEPYSIGCTAEIMQVERLPQGRLNIVAAGRERFRILSLDSRSQLYLVGKVERYPIGVGSPAQLSRQARELRPRLASYLRLLAAIEDTQPQPELQPLPEEPLVLAYLAAAVLQCPPNEKQALLEAANAGNLLDELLSLFRREIALLQAIQTRQAGPDQGSFSSN